MHVGERRGAHGISVGEPDGKRPLGRPTRKWGDNKMVLKEIGWEGVNLIIGHRVETCRGLLCMRQ